MRFDLNANCHLLPSPAGAFNASAGADDNRLRRFLNALLQRPVTEPLSDSAIAQWSGISRDEDAKEFVWRLQELGWLEASENRRIAPEGRIEDILIRLLPALTAGGKALLADAHGFYLSSHGFTHEVAEELSALSADLASLHERRSGSLNRNLGLRGSAWALTNAAGQSQLGFWPLFIGKLRFALVISGTPTFNRPEMVDLVWVLHQRYLIQARP